MNGQIINPDVAAVFHEDADTGVFFERQVEFVKTTAYETMYPARKAMELLPVNFGVNEGAQSIIWYLWDEVGMCKIIAAAGDDIPRIDVKAREFSSPIKPLAGSFGYSVDEIAAARFANVPLSQRKANAAVKAFERLVNKIAWNGDTPTALPGFLNNPNITTGTVPNGASPAATPWSGKTQLEILFDMNLVTKAIISATQGEIVPDTILLPVDQHALIATRNMSVDNDRTILQFFLANNPWIKRVETLPELLAANNSVYATDVIVAYNKSEEFLTLEIPKMFRFEPIERRGLDFIIVRHGRIGGVIIYQPLSVSIYDGI